jgi:hypothetical protein
MDQEIEWQEFGAALVWFRRKQVLGLLWRRTLLHTVSHLVNYLVICDLNFEHTGLETIFKFMKYEIS